MDTIEALIEPIRHSPRLPEVITALSRQMKEEQRMRECFYRDMTPKQKFEFIDGEVVLHSPALNRHLDVTKYVLELFDTYVSINQLGSVKSEKCLCVFPRNDYEPDVVFLGREKTITLILTDKTRLCHCLVK